MAITILKYIQNNLGSTIPAPCNGNHTCGKCLVKISPSITPTKNDIDLINPRLIDLGYRLACDHDYDDKLNIEIVKKEGMEITTDIVSKISNDYPKNENWGFSIDVGTTTVVIRMSKNDESEKAHTRSFYNHQVKFGSDVISRIKASNEGYLSHLHENLIKPIEDNILSLINENFVPKDKLGPIVITGNTTMTYFLLNMSPQSIGRSPFLVDKFSNYSQNVRDIFPHLDFYDNQLFITPYSSAFIGGDILSGMIACDMDLSEEINILIDLGTNGEMVIGNMHSFKSLSTAAGPAFEGGNMSCGTPSIPGAITKVIINADRNDIFTIQNKEPIGVCGTGIISVIAELLRKDILDETGCLNNDEELFFIDKNKDIFITQKDIREFQLSKAAIQTGISILIESVQDQEMIKNIFLSGGFGSNIDVEDLVTIGVVPSTLKNKVKIMQNTALAGAEYLMFTKNIDRFKEIANKIENINLVEHKSFQELFVEALIFEPID